MRKKTIFLVAFLLTTLFSFSSQAKIRANILPKDDQLLLSYQGKKELTPGVAPQTPPTPPPYTNGFVENFDASTNIPTDWDVINEGDPNTWFIQNFINGGAHSGSNAFLIEYHSSEAHNDYLVLPPITVIQNVTDQISFWVKNKNSNHEDAYEVVLSNSGNTPSSSSDFSVVLEPEYAPGTEWEKKTIFLSDYIGQTVYVAIRAVSTDKWYLFLDDVELSGTPTCPKPTSLSAQDISATGANLTWVKGGTETAWNLKVSSSSINPATETADIYNGAATGNPHSLTGLSSLSTYYVYVQANCGNGDVSEWSEEVSFNTLEKYANLPFSNDFETNLGDIILVNGTEKNYWMHGSLTAQTGNALFITDNGSDNQYNNSNTSISHAYIPINFDGVTNATLSFDWVCKGESSYDFLKVYLVTKGTAINAGTQLTSSNLIGERYNQQETLQQASIELTPNKITQDSMKLVFSWRNDNSQGSNPPASIDNIVLRELTCFPPSNIQVNNLMGTSANIYWTPVGTENNWNVIYGEAGFNPDTEGTTIEVTDTFCTINGLSGETSYNVYIQSDCGNNDLSSLSYKQNFTTPITCPKVKNVTSQSITATEATLKWSKGGTESNWNVIYGEENFDPNTEGTTIEVTDTLVTISNLEIKTSYDVYIQANCGAGDLSSSYKYSFTTPCGAYTPDYTQEFSSNFPPDCWTVTSKDINGLPTTSSTNWFKGTLNANNFSAKIYIYGTNIRSWLTSPMFDLSAGNYELRYDIFLEDNNFMGSDDELRVLYTLDGFTWNVLKTHNTDNTTSTTPEQKIINLSDITGTNVIFAFGATSGSESNSSYYLHIDNFIVQTRPSCPEPTDLSAQNITPTGVTLNWQKGEAETNWNVIYGAKDFNPETEGTTTSITDTFITINNLLDQTSYDVYVQADCGNGEQSALSPKYSFTTPCATYTPDYTQDFSSVDNLPDCWKYATKGIDGTPLPSGGYEKWDCGGSCMEVEFGYGDFETGVISPSFDLSAGNYELRYDVNIDSGDDFNGMLSSHEVKVLYTLDGFNWNLLKTYNSNNEPSNTQREIIDMSSINNANVKFAFFATDLSNYSPTPSSYYFKVDNFIIQERPACPEPIGISAQNISITEATLTWQKGNEETNWKVFYGGAGFIPGAGATVISVTDTFVTINNLSEQTTYDVYVQADCGNGELSALSPKFSFTTPCAAYAPNYTQDFSSYDFPPDCWTIKHTDLNGNLISGNQQWRNGYGKATASFQSEMGMIGISWLISPPFDLSSGEHELRYKASLEVYSGNSTMGPEDTLKVLYTLDGINWNLLKTYNFDNSPSTTPQQEIINLSSISGANVKFAFWAKESITRDTYYIFNIDDFMIQTRPSCPAPTILYTQNVSTSEATVAWQKGNEETNWQVIYGETGFTPGTGAGIELSATDTFITIGNLSEQTSYDVYVKADCGSELSEFSLKHSFKTSCDAYTPSYTQDFSSDNFPPDCWRITSQDIDGAPAISGKKWKKYDSFAGLFVSENTNSWLLPPSFNLSSGTYELRYKISISQGETASNDGVRVVYTLDGSNWTTLKKYGISSSASLSKQEIISLSGISGTNVTFAFSVSGASGLSNGYFVELDDFEVKTRPTCPEPIELSVQNISTSEATLTWQKGEAETNWNVVYGEKGFDPNTSGTAVSVTDTFITISGLSFGTQYDTYVQASCASGQLSAFSSKVSFETPCEIYTPPYTQEFSSNSLPTCWDIEAKDIDGSPVSGYYTKWEIESSKASVRIYYDTKSWLISPPFDLSSGDYELTYDLYLSGGIPNMINDDEVKVLYTLDDINWNVLKTYNSDNSPSTTPTKELINLSNISGSNVRIAFGATSGLYIDDNYTFNMDKFIIQERPSCPKPIEVSAQNVSTSEVTLTWKKGEAETNWNVIYGSSGFDPATEGTTISVTDTFITINGLLPNTKYNVYVQADCGNGELSTFTPMVAFETPCEVYTPNYTQDFSFSYLPECWEREEKNIDGTPANHSPEWYLTEGYTAFDFGNSVKSSWLISPAFDLSSGGYELRYDAHAVMSGSSVIMSSDEVRVLYTLDGSNWNTLKAYNTYNSPPYTNQQEIIDLSDITEGDVKFAFWATRTTASYYNTYSFRIDNFIVRSSCPTPTSLSTESVSETEATLTWVPSGEETSWNIIYGASGFDPTTEGTTVSVTDIPTTITNLEQGTTYQAYVQANCGTKLSNFSDIVEFTTESSCNIAITGSVTQPNCFGNKGAISVEASGGTGDYTYAWSNGESTFEINNLEEGNYTVTVRDANNCEAQETFAINQAPSEISITETIQQISCFGANNASISLNVSGGTPDPTNNGYTYAWSNGQTTSNISNLSAGEYTVTVTDIKTCQKEKSFTINDAPEEIVITEILTQPNCFGDKGAISVNVSGGTGTYTYTWSNGESTSEINNLEAGNYTVTVEDTNHCEVEATFAINQAPEEIVISETFHQNSACPGSNEGILAIEVDGGTEPYSYLWSNGLMTDSITDLPGTVDYQVTVTDHNACEKVFTATTITELSIPNIVINTQKPSCGDNNGVVDIMIDQITGTSIYNDYSLLWSTGDTAVQVNNLSSGNYSVNITERSLNCIYTEYFIIDNTEQISLNPDITEASCETCNDGAITLNVTGGLAPYEFIWEDGSTSNSSTDLFPGGYSVTVIDANGCVTTDCIGASNMQNLEVTVGSTNATCGSSDGSATISVTGGSESYSFLWNTNPPQTESTANNLASGFYECTITDNETGSSTAVTIAVGDNGGIGTLDYEVKESICGESSIEVTYTGGSGSETYLWSNGATTQDLSGLNPGLYALLVTDGDCKLARNIQVNSEMPNVQPICMVTVNTLEDDEHNLVIWERSQLENVDHYNIYREDCSGSGSLLGSVGADEITVFEDLTANPSLKSYAYRITAVSPCGIESPMSDVHKTMHLELNANVETGEVQLIWDDYIGFENPTFFVYKKSNNETDYNLLATVNNTQYSYMLDSEEDTVFYAVRVTKTEPCNAWNGNMKANGGPYYHSISNMEDDGMIFVIDNVSSIETGNLSIYPNPVKNVLNIQSSSHIVAIRVYDAAGKQVRHYQNINLDRVQISSNIFEKGVYIFEIETRDTVVKKQVIVQ